MPTATAQSGAVPSTAAELFPYLQSGEYRSFTGESAVHGSVSFHGRVRTYANPSLAASLRRRGRKKEHPKGAAAIKELYNSRDELVGWSVMVKVSKKSKRGRGWYWYQVTANGDGSNPSADGKGLAECVGCHASGGRDMVLSRVPLR